MKIKLLLCSLMLSIIFVACKKDAFNCKEKGVYCDVSQATIATNVDFQDPDNPGPNTVVYILKDLERNTTTGCITDGYVKYVRNGQTAALVDYGLKDAQKWAVITNCVNGDCEDAMAYCTKFEQNCGD